MEENNVAENAVHGVSDISGVNGDAPCSPESGESSASCDAGRTKNAADEAETDTEAEFDALINGKYKEVYKKRTEAIIRKRLKSAKGESEPAKAEVSENEPTGTDGADDITVAASPSADGMGEAITLARQKNRSRPVENGIAGSCGVVARINVDALSGSDVIGLLRRAECGERISFK